MEKLNKVIAGLECCLSDTDCDECCPYFKGEYRMDGCMDEMMAEALELLRRMDQMAMDLEVTRMNLGDSRAECNRLEDELAGLRMWLGRSRWR